MILDITRDHNNLLQKIEDGQKQTFTWDHEILSMESKGCREYYIHDDLGSPIRAIGTNGTEEIYGYDEFGNDLYHNQTLFGYTGYEKDDTTGLLYAQAREYEPETGRFNGEDSAKGAIIIPFTLNPYTYVYNRPLTLVDRNGATPAALQIMENEDTWPGLHGPAKTASDAFYNVRDYIHEELDQAGQQIGNEMARAADNFDQVVETSVSTIQEGIEEAKVKIAENLKTTEEESAERKRKFSEKANEYLEKRMTGEDYIYDEKTESVTYEIKAHKGGKFFIGKYRTGDKLNIGWSINTACSIPKTNISFEDSLSGGGTDIDEWKIKHGLKSFDKKTGCFTVSGTSWDQNGLNIYMSYGGTSGTIPTPIPRSLLETKGDISWSITYEKNIIDRDKAVEVVQEIACVLAIIASIVIIVDDLACVFSDDLLLPPLAGYIAMINPTIANWINSLNVCPA